MIPDPDQLDLVQALQHYTSELHRHLTSKGLLHRFKRPKSLKGFYIYGDVGRGKSFIMDLFFDHLEGIPKRRFHFHGFMQSLHDALQQQRLDQDDRDHRHPMDVIAHQLAKEARVLCFDEFHFKDITDGMLLQQLFRALWREGVIIVATSNYPPEDLYQDGYQRSLILPFLTEMPQHFTLFSLGGKQDYRRQFLNRKRRYFVNDTNALKDLFGHLRGDTPAQPLTLVHKKRTWILPKVANGIAYASFQDLCGNPHNAEDYLELCKHIHTLLISDIPAMDDNILDRVKRFITLIDVIYDQPLNFAASGEIALQEIYQGSKEKALFQRTLSRLVELTGSL